MSSRIRHRRRCRPLLADAANAAYVAVAFTRAALIPEGSWPSVGDNESASPPSRRLVK